MSLFQKAEPSLSTESIFPDNTFRPVVGGLLFGLIACNAPPPAIALLLMPERPNPKWLGMSDK